MGNELNFTRASSELPVHPFTPQGALDVLANDAPSFAETRARRQDDAKKSKDTFAGPLLKAIDNAEVPIVQLFDSRNPHAANDTVVINTSWSNPNGLRADGKLILQYDAQGNPCSAQFRDKHGNVEDIMLDKKTHSFVAEEKYQTAQGVTATLDFDAKDHLAHENIEMANSTEQFDFKGDKLVHQKFVLGGDQVLEFNDGEQKTITASGPASPENPVKTQQFQYDDSESSPRVIQFSVEGGKQYKGVQLKDGRWAVHEVK